MDGVTFRAGTASDALTIGVLGTQVFLDTYATHGVRDALAREVLAQHSTAAVAARLARPRAQCIVAERADHLIGFVELTNGASHALVPMAATEVDRLYVQRRFAGQGIGSQLLDRAAVRAAASGATLLWLTAWIGNHAALAFYARRGFEDLGPTDYEFEGEHYENRVLARAIVHTGSSASAGARI